MAQVETGPGVHAGAIVEAGRDGCRARIGEKLTRGAHKAWRALARVVAARAVHALDSVILAHAQLAHVDVELARVATIAVRTFANVGTVQLFHAAASVDARQADAAVES